MARKILTWLSLAMSLVFTSSVSRSSSGAANDAVGRWDLTVGPAGAAYPSWLEVTRNGNKYSGRFVGRVGSARPIKQMEFDGGRLKFSLPPQYEKMKGDLVFEGSLSASGRELKGKAIVEEGADQPWSGVPAPPLPGNPSPKWGPPRPIFNGRDMTGWKLKDPKLPNGWKVVNGILENDMPSSDIVTTESFRDFSLHIEFNVAPKSNSGVYLRGRYEVQIQDDFGKPPESHFIGGLYGFIDPTENAGKKAGEWQKYDITLLGRYLTVVLNDKTVISNKEIPGITGGALDSREGEPGPLMLQGDHGKVSFRNLVLKVAQ
jgi:hypothetical protein